MQQLLADDNEVTGIILFNLFHETLLHPSGKRLFCRCKIQKSSDEKILVRGLLKPTLTKLLLILIGSISKNTSNINRKFPWLLAKRWGFLKSFCNDLIKSDCSEQLVLRY